MLAPKKHCKSYTKTMDAVSRNSFSILKSAQFLGRLTLKFTRVGSDLKKNCTAVSWNFAFIKVIHFLFQL